MKRLWSSISGLPVTAERQTRPLGNLNAVFLHPETGKIIAFLIGVSRVLSPVDIEKWRSNSVQISDRDRIVEPTELLRLKTFGIRRCFILGKKVISKSGKSLGRLRDFTFESNSGYLLTFHASKSFLGFKWEQRILPFKCISEITEKAILLDIEPEAPEPTRSLRQELQPQE